MRYQSLQSFVPILFAALPLSASAEPDFRSEILPILEKQCLSCHSVFDKEGQPKKPKGKVALDSKEGILGSKDGKLLGAGVPDKSLLLEAITRSKRPMPPPSEGDPLPPEQVEAIKNWISAGAQFGDWVGRPATSDEPEPQAVGMEKPTPPKRDLVAMFPHWTESEKIQGDLAAGRKLYGERTWGNAFTCAACHSYDPRDTMSLDGDGLIRAGMPIYAAAQRTDIKGSGTSSAELGANLCVVHFQHGPATGMSPQQFADLRAFLQDGGGVAHWTARNIDFATKSQAVTEELTGGDAGKGAALAQQTCLACHDVDGNKHIVVKGGDPLEGGTYSPDDLKDLALRIRNPDFKINEAMPGFSNQRISDEGLRDLLAWLTATPPPPKGK